MNRIIAKRILSKELIRLEISTPVALRAIEPGQYVVVKTKAEATGITLPVIKADAEKGTLTVIGCPSDKGDNGLSLMLAGSVFHAIEGPFGMPLQIRNEGTVLCVADQKGILALLPVMAALRRSGSTVIALLWASACQEVLLEEEISAMASQVIILTADGSQGQHTTLGRGLSRVLKEHLIGQVVVMGNACTIRDTFATTILHPVATQALLVSNPAGRNVHGIFTVSICGNVRSVRVEGHNFSAYYATFDEMVRRFEQAKETTVAAEELLSKRM